MRRLKIRQVVKALRKLGWEPERYRGDHQIWRGPCGHTIAVNRGHDNKEASWNLIKQLQEAEGRAT